MKKHMRLFGILLAFIGLLLIVIFAYHRIMLSRENGLRQTSSQLVDLPEGKISVYKGGHGDKTLVFLAGGGTSSPILDFRTLTNLLEEDFQVVVIERFGYGFSDDVSVSRDIETVLENSRAALREVGVTDPVILVPHSMSGLESLYWAQKYPDEVAVIIGLDMSIPAAYQDLTIHTTLLKLAQFSARLGLTRVLYPLMVPDAVSAGQLTPDEKNQYKALFHHGTLTNAMMLETKSVKQNANIVASSPLPDIPYLLFSSNCQGTGFSTQKWQSFQEAFVSEVPQATLVKVDAPHYLHNYKADEIAHQIHEFLLSLEE